jgi:hypothetical protein
MNHLPSLKDIDQISLDILKGSKSWGILPTPVDRIVDFSELIVNKTVDISSVHEGYLKRAPAALFKALAKVRGLFDRTKQTIYLDLSQLPTRQNFVKLHETGHGVLPWQKKIHEILEDDDDSLGTHTTEEFEMEANYFASVTLFQHDRFNDEIKKLNLGIDSAMHLAKLFGASIHATLRNYVENSSKRCALLVLEKSSVSGEKNAFPRKNFIVSFRFSKTFGNIVFPEVFNLNWEFAKDFYYRKRGIISGEVSLITENGDEIFKYQFFNNTYNGFVLLYPDGQKQSSKTKIIITDKNSGLIT